MLRHVWRGVEPVWFGYGQHYSKGWSCGTDDKNSSSPGLREYFTQALPYKVSISAPVKLQREKKKHLLQTCLFNVMKLFTVAYHRRRLGMAT